MEKVQSQTGTPLVEQEDITGFSLKTILITTIGILLFVMYVGILMYGENSLTVLTDLKKKKENLLSEQKSLKNENQRLQKTFFELNQLESKE